MVKYFIYCFIWTPKGSSTFFSGTSYFKGTNIELFEHINSQSEESVAMTSYMESLRKDT